MRLTHLLGTGLLGGLLLMGCTPSTDSSENPDAPVATDSVTPTDDAPDTDSTATAAGAIDWSKLDTGVTKVAPSDYDYPFAPDSQPVQSYMDYFDVDAPTAQYNLTVSMASNEALSKLLDQLGTNYVSHEIIDGNNLKMVVHTTDAIPATTYEYVIEEAFGKGLVLPIEIVPDGVKAAATDAVSEAHAGS